MNALYQEQTQSIQNKLTNSEVHHEEHIHSLKETIATQKTENETLSLQVSEQQLQISA